MADINEAQPTTSDTDNADQAADEPETEVVEIRSTRATTDPEVITILEEGEINVLGRMPWSSNGTFLVEVTSGDDLVQAIYKPERGERPLWDFPAGLWRRERAAYLVSEALGWGLVPPTAVRHDAPIGVGSMQCFVPAKFDDHYFVLIEEQRYHPALRTLAAFDVLTNNTDRKGGHCLLDLNDRIWAIDHGLSFHEEFKLRTVIWEFAGTPLDAEIAQSVMSFVESPVSDELSDLLMPSEVEAMLSRGRALVASARFPIDPTGRQYPWPLV